MPQLGPHISIPAEALLSRVLGLDPFDFKGWPEDVRTLAESIAAELFLVRYNPFIDPELVRKSVSRTLTLARPTLSGEYPQRLTRAVENFWLKQDADQEFKARFIEKMKEILPEHCIGLGPHTIVQSATDATDLRIELPIAVFFLKTQSRSEQLYVSLTRCSSVLSPAGAEPELRAELFRLLTAQLFFH